MTDQQKVREAFEAWITSRSWYERLHCNLKQASDGNYCNYKVNDRWLSWKAAIAHASSATVKENLTGGEGEAGADEPSTDREALVYLMRAFDTESWQCPRCGHDEDCATMDSAFFLRDYLRAHPAPSAEDARDADNEEWRQINDAYSVSDQGRVMHADRVLHPYKKGKGYLAVSMWIDGVSTECYVHRLVAEAFCLREHESQDQVNHRDGERTNNNAENLEWCTAKENRIHSAKVRYVGTRPVIGTNVVTGEEIRFESIADAEQHGFKRANIQKCISGLRKKHGGHYWRAAIDQALAAERGEGNG